MMGGFGDPMMMGGFGDPMMMGGPEAAYQAGLQDGIAAAGGGECQDPYEAGFQEGVKSVEQQETIQQIVGLLSNLLSGGAGGGGCGPQGGNNSIAVASAGFA
jgi:hypothetical protein